MRGFLIAVAMCFGVGCADQVGEGRVVAPSASVDGPVVIATANQTDFCDDYGCRYLTVGSPVYYGVGGVPYYYDRHFGAWIGRGGYWRGGSYYRGYHPGYYGYYGAHAYHSYYGVGYRNGFGGGFHGGRR